MKEKQIHYECPKCKVKFPSFVTTMFVLTTGQIVPKAERPRYCPQCNGGLIRRVDE